LFQKFYAGAEKASMEMLKLFSVHVRAIHCHYNNLLCELISNPEGMQTTLFGDLKNIIAEIDLSNAGKGDPACEKARALHQRRCIANS
jgi:hypothetical protein